MDENGIAEILVDRSLRIHKILGPGLLESSYEACLFYELQKAGLKTERQKALPLQYGDVQLDCGYRVDLLVENKVIVEVKSVDALNDIHMAQVITYLKLSGCRLGFLINFNVRLIKHGIKRIVHGL